MRGRVPAGVTPAADWSSRAASRTLPRVGSPMTALSVAVVLLLAAAPAKGKTPTAQRRGKAGKGQVALSALQPRPAAPLALRPVGVRPLDEHGAVRQATRQRAYLDAGTREGLHPGQVIPLLRRGERAGSCTVETVSERNATCTGSGIRAGDTFAVSLRTAGSAPAQLPARPSAEEQARRLALVQSVGFVPIEHRGKGPEPAERRRPVEVGLGHFSWLATDTPGIHQEQIWAVARDVEVWRSALLNLDLLAAYRTAMPATERFRPGRSAELFVREASLAWAGQGPWRLAAGRVLPWTFPGGSTFDGMQVGYRPGRSEIGIFGGGVPDPVTTAPGVNRATAGAYWSWEAALGRSLLRNEARLAWVHLPGSKTRLEGEATGQAWLFRQVDLSGQVRVAGGDYAAPSKIDAARIDLAWRVPGWLSMYGGYRWSDVSFPEVAAPAVYPGRTRHADGALTWERLGWLQIRAAAGRVLDVTSDYHRTWVGPELVAPRLFGRWGGLAAGYQEEMGTLGGRSGWLQASLALPRTQLLARASWFMDDRPAPLDAEQNLGLTLSLVSDLSAALRLRLGATSRYLVPIAENGQDRYGAAAFAALEARY